MMMLGVLTIIFVLFAAWCCICMAAKEGDEE